MILQIYKSVSTGGEKYIDLDLFNKDKNLYELIVK